MRRRTGITAALVAATALLGGVADAQGTWTAEPFPQRPDVPSTIATASSGSGETWAFGGFSQAGGTSNAQAYRRGDDGKWAEVLVPAVGTVVSSAVVGPDEVWAIGWGCKNTAGTLLRWDGAAWVEVPVAVPGATRVRPDDVLATGGEPWVVGKGYEDGDEPRQQTFVRRWDGATLQDVPVPGPAHEATFTALGGNPDDLWLVGTRDGAAVSMHWDGTAWTEVPVPEVEVPGGAQLAVNDVATAAPDDVWLAGGVRDDDQTQARPVLLHWDGSAWTEAPAANSPGEPGEFVHAGGAVWNIADEGVLRYDGTRWQTVAGPAEGPLATGAETSDGRLLVLGSTGELPRTAPFAAVRTG
ncbi:hypothetical protein EIL87_18520 [Saccharopolyspora rhizosphaerae]|uniref:Galactose oxidase n=1 Tax=Saccharopolyspora rhizosphaerae TaxID=2492662 RepID=A0A426JNS0_9PSEU|nr:hypothetical protein [Saccharopolyspora rhizosphaerae]RRO14735.1 hypothetical protein EIL87_18520 [Saccharopolyspora rhizosphaerae]